MEHLFSMSGWFDEPVVRIALIAAVAGLALTPLVTFALSRAGIMTAATRADVLVRWKTWLFLVPMIGVPIVVCAAGAMGLVTLLSLLCYREYARATGVFRERLMSVIVVLAIAALTFANVDHWYGMFVAITPLAIAVLAGAAVLEDRPKGYIQRVSLAAVGYLLFGASLGHLGFIANDPRYRSILCMLILCVQGSDIASYICGRAFGRRHVFPNTSPKKTLGGHLGALVIITPLAAYMGHLTFAGTALDTTPRLIGLGLIIAIGAQLGDLVLGSIKRDLGVKDLDVSLPGHGGFSDRCNSLLLVAPAAFYYIRYFIGIAMERAPGVFTGGGAMGGGTP